MNHRNGATKIRVTILCARNLAKRDLFRLPDPFVKVSVDGTGQTHATDSCKNTLDPKWNQHYDLYIGKADAITISVWNDKKVHKNRNNGGSGGGGATGFLGCVRLHANAIHRLKDTGYQRLDLVSDNNNPLPVKGQIVVSLMSRDGYGAGSLNAVVDPLGNLSGCPADVPEGWEERRTPTGRVYYVNHYLRTTQWERPTRPATEISGVSQHARFAATGESSPAAAPPSSPAVLSPSPPSLLPSSSCSNINNNCDDDSPPAVAVGTAAAASGPTNNSNAVVVSPQRPAPLPPSSPMSPPTACDSERPARKVAAANNYPHQRGAKAGGGVARAVLHQPPDLPDGFEMRTTQQGQIYFHHLPTGVSTW
jgi:E3 ubiquitin ligase SMURF1/2